jgi:hypothetical protein
MILLPKPSQNFPRVSLLEPGFLGCSPNVNSSCCRGQGEGQLICPYHMCISSCMMTRFNGRDTIVYTSEHYFSIIRGLAIAALLYMLDLWNSHQTVFVETQSSRWIFSSAVTCAAVVLLFFKTILPNVRWSLSVNVDFHPLFLIADVVFLWFVNANFTLETVALDTHNNVAVLSHAAAECTPMIYPHPKLDRSSIFWFFHADCHSTQSRLHWDEYYRP